MDVTAVPRRLLCCLTLLFSLHGGLLPTLHYVDAEPTHDFSGVIKKVKKGAHYFTECSIDNLAMYCTTETALNFECFRTIGECIPGMLREALLDPAEEDDDTQEEDGDVLSDEL